MPRETSMRDLIFKLVPQFMILSFCSLSMRIGRELPLVAESRHSRPTAYDPKKTYKLLDGQVSRFSPFKNVVHVGGSASARGGNRPRIRIESAWHDMIQRLCVIRP